MKRVKAASEVQPAGVSGCNSFRMMSAIISTPLIPAIAAPAMEAILKGNTEKLVAIFSQRDTERRRL